MLNATFATPITRAQWATWLENNLTEFHERMKTASQRRCLGNTRVRARADLPKPAQRIQPKAETTAQFKTEWAANFAGRTGWHGIQTTTDKMMFFLAWHHGKTFFIDLEPNRVTGHDVSYALTQDFDLVGQLKPLSSLDAAITDDVVKGRTFRFDVHTTPTTGGLLMEPSQGVSHYGSFSSGEARSLSLVDG